MEDEKISIGKKEGPRSEEKKVEEKVVAGEQREKMTRETLSKNYSVRQTSRDIDDGSNC